MGIKIVVFIFLAFGVYAKWEPLERVDENCTTEMKRATIYIDQITRISHYFWCQLDERSGRFYLYYRKQIPEGILYPETILDISHSCEGVSVAGSSDGRRIYLAYSAERSRARTSCNEDITDGCMDIYTLESLDSGDSWSLPVVLPRKNLKDIRNRWSPKILIDPLSSRLWIFYITQETEEMMYSIGYVQRTSSSIYNSEVLMNSRKELILDVTAAVSNPGPVIIHLIWSGEVNQALAMNQLISTNNGVSWRAVGMIDRGFGGNMVSDIIMNAKNMYIPFLKQMGAPTQLKMSVDGGSKWSSFQISQYSGLPDICLCFKSFGNDGTVFSLLNAKISEGNYIGEFGYLRVIDRRWIKADKPFGNFILNYDPNLRCYVENGQYIVKAIAISKNTNLYVTKNVVG